MECSGACSLSWRSLSAGAAACSVPYCMYREVCSPSQPNAKQANKLGTKNPGSCTLVVYIAGDTLCHQPMGAGNITVLQLCGPMGFRVLQWCHPMLASTKRTSRCTRIITLYGKRKVDSGPHTDSSCLEMGKYCLCNSNVIAGINLEIADIDHFFYNSTTSSLYWSL